ncbi:hypothetical protein ACEPAI_2192 [Sanghuangporus weigelae]
MVERRLQRESSMPKASREELVRYLADPLETGCPTSLMFATNGSAVLSGRPLHKFMTYALGDLVTGICRQLPAEEGLHLDYNRLLSAFYVTGPDGSKEYHIPLSVSGVVSEGATDVRPTKGAECMKGPPKMGCRRYQTLKDLLPGRCQEPSET